MEYYNYIKSIHLVFVITWFAGLFYIPRLFIYQIESAAKKDPEKSILINQPYATRTENVTPYLVNYYSGTIELNPCSDCWVEQIQLAAQRVEVENYTSTLVQTADGDFHCGMDNVIWDAFR